MSGVQWPTVIEWRITGACNERCAFCYGPPHSDTPDSDTVERLLTIVGESPTPVIRITGGEPLLYPDIEHVLERLHVDYRKQLVLSTNAWRANDHFDTLVRHVSKLNLPIEGADKATHAHSSRSAGSLDDVIELLRRLSSEETRPYVKVGTVVDGRSMDVGYLRSIYELIEPLPVDRWKIYQFVPVGPISDKSLVISDEKYNEHVRDLREFVGGFDGLTPEIVPADASSRDSAYFLLEPNGSVFIPIGNEKKALQLRLGNLLDDDIEEVVAQWIERSNMGNHLNNAWIYSKLNQQ